MDVCVGYRRAVAIGYHGPGYAAGRIEGEVDVGGVGRGGHGDARRLFSVCRVVVKLGYEALIVGAGAYAVVVGVEAGDAVGPVGGGRCDRATSARVVKLGSHVRVLYGRAVGFGDRARDSASHRQREVDTRCIGVRRDRHGVGVGTIRRLVVVLADEHLADGRCLNPSTRRRASP